jgi:hypothetical protein
MTIDYFAKVLIFAIFSVKTFIFEQKRLFFAHFEQKRLFLSKNLHFRALFCENVHLLAKIALPIKSPRHRI